MAHAATAPPAGTLEERREAVDRIMQSAAFRRSPRLREMLQYIARHTLAGSLEELTETRIAENVFHRAAYNPAEDNLVRVSARQLRAKLAEYYAGEGSREEIVCDIPKGGYLAVFRLREDHQIELIDTAAVSLTRPKPQPRLWSWLTVVLAVCLAAVVIWAVYLFSENRRLRIQPRLQATLFAPVLPTAQQRTHIVITDSALVLLEHLAHQNPSLNDYASYRYLQLVPGEIQHGSQADFFRSLSTRQISSLADLRIVWSILQSYPQQARGIALHHARNLHARDFDNDDNFVLIGSPRSNPWGALVENALNFRFQSGYDAPCIENIHPLAGEQALYCSEHPGREQGVDYARVVMVRNGHRKGKMVIIAGIAMESTEAAGEFFMNPESAPQVLKWLHAKSLATLPDYELLLKTYDVGGSGRSAEIIAARAH